MKKIISILITASVLLSACKKEHHIKMDTSDIQKVTFQVGFSQTDGSFETNLKLAAADTSVTNNINMLYYMVFDSNGRLIHNVSQKITDANFGTFTDNLHAGSYTVAVAGLKGPLDYTAGDLNTQVLHTDLIELFFKKVTFTVSGSGLTQAINLQRVNSKLQVVIKDKIPANVTLIKIQAVRLYTDFLIGTETVGHLYTKTFSFPIPPEAIGTSNYTLSSATFLSNGTLALDITAVDAGGTIISEKILNVTTAKNKVTLLTGNLFGGNGGSGGGFTLSLPNWNTPTTQGF